MARILRLSKVKLGGFFAIPNIDDLKVSELTLSGRQIFVRGHYNHSIKKYSYISCADVYFSSFLPSNTLVIVK